MNSLASLIHLYNKIANIEHFICNIFNSVIENLLTKEVICLQSYNNLTNKKIIINLEQHIYLLNIYHNKIKLSLNKQSPLEIDADLQITTNLNAIEKLINKSKTIEELIKSEDILLSGNTNLVVDLINIIASLDLALDNILSFYIGDIAAYLLADFLKKAKSKLENQIDNFINSVQSSFASNNNDPFIDHSIKQNNNNELHKNIANMLSALNLKLPKETLTIINNFKSFLDNLSYNLNEIIEQQQKNDDLNSNEITEPKVLTVDKKNLTNFNK